MTKVLIITNKSDITSDFVVRSLRIQNISFYRFNTEELTKTIELTIDFSQNIFEIIDQSSKEVHNLQGFTSVYYRRPEIPVLNAADLSHGELSFLKSELIYNLEGLYKLLRDLYWISPVYSIREAENKIYQLDIARSIGFDIPESIVSNSYQRITSFFNKREKCIIKPVKSGLIEDEKEPKVVFTSHLDSLPDNGKQIFSSPNFLQSEIIKKGDVRVIMVGNSFFATLIDSQQYSETKTDWRRGEMKLDHIKIDLPDRIKSLCLILMRKLNLRYAAFDFVLDQYDNYIFLEANPNGQWAWIENLTGYEISKEIVRLLTDESF